MIYHPSALSHIEVLTLTSLMSKPSALRSVWQPAPTVFWSLPPQKSSLISSTLPAVNRAEGQAEVCIQKGNLGWMITSAITKKWNVDKQSVKGRNLLWLCIWISWKDTLTQHNNICMEARPHYFLITSQPTDTTLLSCLKLFICW